ncbi:3-hydroxyisobutyrate dehydrogenase [Actinopolyspora lacussalsi subsp. righensis]|uniref:3-hydroxyisobutyrate dehydrogenase n=1 Tax=Actinopolyspora righensis TaxID=995060 RepID=A0A1I6XEA7_9ACTN|nr:NAD(P)-binding domain-containing protein [Actinopolyspora righensis]SFT36491.1 3-hydroxyisobutyrate dehydrogenase [Actinopolyspora righensis]
MTAANREPVTILGLGPMGQALAGAFLNNGHPTTMWNRTESKADALVTEGAHRSETVVDAVAASDLVIACVIDYDAVQAIVEPAATALKGKTLVNLTADSPARAREMADWAAEHGIEYLDGAIMTPAPTIGGSAAVVLYAGSQALYEIHEPTLSNLGGTAAHLGTDPGRAAAHDVSLLDMFWTGMAGMVHGFALAKAEGIEAVDLAPYAKGIVNLLPDIMSDFAERIDEDRFTGDISNIRSAAAGMDHIIHAAHNRDIETGVLNAATALAKRATESGYGAESFARLSQVLRDA